MKYFIFPASLILNINLEKCQIATTTEMSPIIAGHDYIDIRVVFASFCSVLGSLSTYFMLSLDGY